jgi:CRISPR-associated endonuclease/helicase Cas3
MKFYAHTAKNREGETLFTFKAFAGKQLTARQFSQTTGRRHRLEDLAEDQIGWQPLRTHLVDVAGKARRFAALFGFEEQAWLTGVLHDLGKYGKKFQFRLRGRGSGINHWTAGAFEAYRAKAQGAAFAINGHHNGIPSLAELQNLLRAYQQGGNLEQFGITETVSELTERARAEGILIPEAEYRDQFSRCFVSAFHARLLFSCLVDADFLDTEAHFQPTSTAMRRSMILRAEESLAALLAVLRSKASEGEVNRRRRDLLEDCLAKAKMPRGLFTLTAPTGSGKTLASLAFALQHVLHHNDPLPPDDVHRLRRVIVVIPYTTVIEQTANEYRKVFESQFGADYVVEHHSAIAPRPTDSDRERDAEDARLRRARLAAENWDAPIVVTTSVQFFESLFSNRPSDCRKLHNIARSVVVFDEVQTLPPKLVPSLLSGVNLLVKDFGVTAVLGTATQPAFECAGPAVLGQWKPAPIESDPEALAEAMRRTRIEIAPADRQLSWQEIVAEMTSPSDQRDRPQQALCVVNTTKNARDLFRILKKSQLGPHCFHLSSRMCPAHRQGKLKEVRRRLDPTVAEPCLLISTQLIEAGVDVDFPVVWRALGPLDSIIQSAGRCNREGRSVEPCPVHVFRPAEGGMPPGAYEIALKRTEAFLNANPGIEQRLHLPETYRAYFACLYRDLGRDSADEDLVFAASRELRFPDASEACRLIGQEMRAVLVKWPDDHNGGGKLIAKLSRQKHLALEEWRELQRFSVNLYQGEFLDGQIKGHIVEAIEGVWFWNSKYDDNLGACHPEGDDFCL